MTRRFVYLMTLWMPTFKPVHLSDSSFHKFSFALESSPASSQSFSPCRARNFEPVRSWIDVRWSFFYLLKFATPVASSAQVRTVYWRGRRSFRPEPWCRAESICLSYSFLRIAQKIDYMRSTLRPIILWSRVEDDTRCSRPIGTYAGVVPTHLVSSYLRFVWRPMPERDHSKWTHKRHRGGDRRPIMNRCPTYRYKIRIPFVQLNFPFILFTYILCMYIMFRKYWTRTMR